MSFPNKPGVPFQLQIVAASILFGTLINAGIGIFLVGAGTLPPLGLLAMTDQVYALLSLGALGLGLAAILASFLMRRHLVGKLKDGAGDAQALSRVVVACMALAETGAAVGLVLALLTSRLLVPGLLWGMALGAGVLHFPTRAWLIEHYSEQFPQP